MIAIPRYQEHNHPKEKCKHPPPWDKHKWHHGYGHYCTGNICRTCGAWTAWETMTEPCNWNDPPIKIYRGDSWDG